MKNTAILPKIGHMSIFKMFFTLEQVFVATSFSGTKPDSRIIIHVTEDLRNEFPSQLIWFHFVSFLSNWIPKLSIWLLSKEV